jgi:hypothetical protein
VARPSPYKLKGTAAPSKRPRRLEPIKSVHSIWRIVLAVVLVGCCVGGAVAWAVVDHSDSPAATSAMTPVESAACSDFAKVNTDLDKGTDPPVALVDDVVKDGQEASNADIRAGATQVHAALTQSSETVFDTDWSSAITDFDLGCPTQ